MHHPEGARDRQQRKSYADVVKIEHLFAEIEKKATQCLVTDPAPDLVRDLANDVIDLIGQLRAGAHPYRQATLQPTGEVAALVSLERALDECEQKLNAAQKEIAALKKR
jgi:hypothetical protein